MVFYESNGKKENKWEFSHGLGTSFFYTYQYFTYVVFLSSKSELSHVEP